MDRNERLAAVLAELARTMVTDFPIKGILDRLVERIVDVLPVTAAGVTVMSENTRPHHVAASNDAALQLEKLQSTLGHGPCVLAYQTGIAVSVPDIGSDVRFRDFSDRAASVGLSAVFAFPLRHNDERMGALDLFRDSPGPLDPWATSVGQTLADVAAAYLVNAQGRDEAERTTALLRVNSLHDALTGLPNRLMLQQRLEEASRRAHRNHATAAVLFADLDGFKQVNDTYGHSTGDALLIAVARRLHGLLRPGDTLARVSGDEFVILCEDLPSVSAAITLADRITQGFTAPFTVPSRDGAGGFAIAITASVGIAFAGHADDIGVQLIHDADVAMYQVKRQGGATHQVVDVREATRAADRVELENDLRKALRSGRLALAYQPIVRATDGLVTGAEALLRWRHPSRGVQSAQATIALAERSSLIGEIGEWVLGRSVLDRSRWLSKHPDQPLNLAVNVSVRELTAAGYVTGVARTLERAGMDPAALTLEMTESIFVEDGEHAMTVLSDLKKLGVQLALDDFGTGYSSLSYLRQFPVDIVKIDQGFVADIGVEPAGVAIVGAVTKLAHVLGLEVTVEGVETSTQREEVVRIGCDSAQGFLYARPMASRDLLAKLAASASASGLYHLPPRASADEG